MPLVRYLILLFISANVSAQSSELSTCDRCETYAKKIIFYSAKEKNYDSAFKYVFSAKFLATQCAKCSEDAESGVTRLLQVIKEEQSNAANEKGSVDSLKRSIEEVQRLLLEQKERLSLKDREYQSLYLSSQANFYFQKYHDFIRGYRYAKEAYSKDSNNVDAKRALYSINFQSPKWRVVFDEKAFMHHDCIKLAEFSFDEDKIMTITENGFVKLWDIKDSSNNEIFLSKENKQFHSAVFANRHQCILTAGYNESAAVVWAYDGKISDTIEHANEVMNAIFSPDDNLILTIADDSSVTISDVLSSPTKKIKRRPFKFDFPVNSASFSQDGKLMLTIVRRGLAASVWYTDVDSHPINCPINKDWISGVFSPNKSHPCVALVSNDDSVIIWNYVVGSIVPLILPNMDVRSIRFSTDGNYLAAATSDGNTIIWNTNTWQTMHVLTGHTGAVNSVSFSSDNRFIVTASDDNTAKVWELASGIEIATLVGHTKSVRSAFFSKDGKHVLTGSSDLTSRIWNISNGDESISISERSKTLDKICAKWNIDVKAVRHLIESKNQDTVYSPSKKLIMSSSDGGTIKIWDTRTHQELATLYGSHYPAIFSSDEKYALTIDEDNTVKIWDIYIPDIIENLNRKIEKVSPEGKSKFDIK